MKAHALKFACLVIVSGLAVAAARAQDVDESGVRSRILALEHAWNQAEGFKDMKALDALFDNALIYVDIDGTLMTKAEFLSRVKSAPVQQVVTESMTVQVFGPAAIATGTYVSKEFKDGKAVLHRGRFVDTWVIKDKTWICVAAQATPVLH